MSSSTCSSPTDSNGKAEDDGVLELANDEENVEEDSTRLCTSLMPKCKSRLSKFEFPGGMNRDASFESGFTSSRPRGVLATPSWGLKRTRGLAGVGGGVGRPMSEASALTSVAEDVCAGDWARPP